MVIKKGFNIRIYPSADQKALFAKTFGACRWLYNQMLALQKERYDNSSEAGFLTTYSMNYILTQLKRECPWLKEADATALTGVNDNLGRAFRNFFQKNAKAPRFKSKKHEQSYISKCVNNNMRIIDGHHILIPKAGILYYRSGLIPHGRICSVTIRMKPSGKYYASVHCEYEEEPLAKTGNAIGIDVGLKNLAVLSDGTKIPAVRFDKALEDKLVYWQRIMSRRLLKAKEAMREDPNLKLSDFRNYWKAKQMVAKINEHIASQRRDYLQKITTELVRKYDVIVVEDLYASHMIKNHKLARAIANAGWREFVTMLEYKCGFYEKELRKVDPRSTSQMCSDCGCINNRLGFSSYGWLKVREWNCPICGAHHDRDVNAAINILNLGLA